MKEIPLTYGKVTLVDDDMFKYFMQWDWSAQQAKNKTWYAARWSQEGIVLMHREVLNAPVGLEVDHRDGNGLHNFRENLRLCTHAQNMRNRKVISANNTSGYKGVFWAKWANKWRVVVRHNWKNVHVGYYDIAIEGAHAYDEKAKELFGEFARTNF